jgi:hypothetical protein
LGVSSQRVEEGGCLRVKSALFKQTPKLSTVMGSMLWVGSRAGARDPRSKLDRYPGEHLVSFPTVVATDHELTVEWCPELYEPAHCDVEGKRPERVVQALLRESRWEEAPVGACPKPIGPTG